MVHKFKFSAFKAFLLAVTLMPLAVSATGPIPVQSPLQISVPTPVADMSKGSPRVITGYVDMLPLNAPSYWTPNPDLTDGKYKEGEQYTFGAFLQASEGYVFNSDIEVHVNGKPAEIIDNFGKTLYIYYEFQATKAIGIKINDKDVKVTDGDIRYNDVSCNRSINLEIFADADIEINGKTGNQTLEYPSMPLPNYGDNKSTIRINFDPPNPPVDYNLVVNRAIDFDYIVKTKWNNVLVVKNKDPEYDGLNFTEFQWFMNGDPIPGATRQFYSVDPVNGAAFSGSHQYSVKMKTEDGMEVRSCSGYPSIAKYSHPATQKQVLGINGKAVPQDSEIYNTKGERVIGKNPGVYIIRRPSK